MLEKLAAERLGQHGQDSVVGKEQVVGPAELASLLVVCKARAQLGQRHDFVYAQGQLALECSFDGLDGVVLDQNADARLFHGVQRVWDGDRDALVLALLGGLEQGDDERDGLGLLQQALLLARGTFPAHIVHQGLDGALHAGGRHARLFREDDRGVAAAVAVVAVAGYVLLLALFLLAKDIDLGPGHRGAVLVRSRQVGGQVGGQAKGA